MHSDLGLDVKDLRLDLRLASKDLRLDVRDLRTSLFAILAMSYKCLAVAEMGDLLDTVDVGQKLRGCAPYGLKLDPHLTQCGLGQDLFLY